MRKRATRRRLRSSGLLGTDTTVWANFYDRQSRYSDAVISIAVIELTPDNAAAYSILGASISHGRS